MLNEFGYSLEKIQGDWCDINNIYICRKFGAMFTKQSIKEQFGSEINPDEIKILSHNQADEGYICFIDFSPSRELNWAQRVMKNEQYTIYIELFPEYNTCSSCDNLTQISDKVTKSVSLLGDFEVKIERNIKNKRLSKHSKQNKKYNYKQNKKQKVDSNLKRKLERKNKLKQHSRNKKISSMNKYIQQYNVNIYSSFDENDYDSSSVSDCEYNINMNYYGFDDYYDYMESLVDSYR